MFLEFSLKCDLFSHSLIEYYDSVVLSTINSLKETEKVILINFPGPFLEISHLRSVF